MLVTDRLRSLRLGDRMVEQVGLPYHWGAQRDHDRRLPERPGQRHHGPQRLHPGQGRHLRHPARPQAAGPRPHGVRRGLPASAPGSTRSTRRTEARTDGFLVGTARRRDRRRGVRRPPAADGLLHRHLGVHRVQGLRGGLQGVEPGPRRRVRADRHVLRQHPGARGEHLAPRRLRGEARWPSDDDRPRPARHGAAGMGHPRERPALGRGPGHGLRRRGHPVADVLRRLQALHARGLPRRVPDGVAVPHRVRHRRRPARHLQRLRLLRAGLSRTA